MKVHGSAKPPKEFNDAIHERLFQLKKEYGLQIGITTSGSNQSDIINIAKTIAVNDEGLFDSYQVTYNVFEQSAFDALQELKTLGKTIIIKEALANGRVFTNKNIKNHLEALSKTYNTNHKHGNNNFCIRVVCSILEFLPNK